ncbi:MAG TPA: MFS transporter [Thermoleophilaceae bacterium]|nr:MFS transporter [Thermoleophilaceae bacterium]
MERKWWTLLGVCVATFMLLLDVTIVNVALPSIERELHAGLTKLQWVIDAYTLVLSALILSAGALADRVGRRLVFSLGVGAFTVASLLCGFAPNATLLDVARGLQGIGGAAMFATSLALIGQEFRGREFGTAIAAWGATVGAAVAAGPLIGGVLTEGLGWEWIFFVNVPVGAVALALALRGMHEFRDPDARGLDPGGLITFSTAFGLLVFGLLRGNAEGWDSALILGSLVGSVVLLAAFVAIERRQERPMLDLSLFRRPAFVGVSFGTLAIGAGMFSILLFVSIYFQDVLDYSPFKAGLRFLPLTLLIFIVPIVTRGLAGRVPPRVMLGGGLALVGLGLLLMHGLERGSGWTALLPGMIAAGVGIGLANPAIGTTALGVVEPNRSGMASGFSNTCRLGGVTIGVAALGAIFENRIDAKLAELVPHVPPGLGTSVAARGTNGVPARFAGAAREAFVAGFNEILLVGSATVLVGSVAVLLLIRARDFVSAREPAAAPAEA